MSPHSQSKDELLKNLSTSVQTGLSSERVSELAAKFGPNKLNEKKKKTNLQRFLEQFKDVMIIILLIAAMISFVIACIEGDPMEFFEPVLILLIVILNAIMGMVQESKAEKALDALKNMSAPHARVLRDGEEKVIDASQLVPGDIIRLEAGDFVPADARLLKSVSLKSEESALTGESVPSEKDAEAEVEEKAALGDRSNMVFSGCSITYGTATAVVTGTGMHTEMGKIAGLLDGESETQTPLQKKLAQLGKYLGILALAACAVIFVIGLLNGIDVLEIFMTAVSLAVSAIPEGLPAIVTIVLAIGVQRMVKKNALIRRLPAVETLGSATVICSDKTGTLTLNQMTVTHIAVNGDFAAGQGTPVAEAAQHHPKVYQELIYAAALCNDASLDPDHPGQIIGAPTEGALIYLAQAFGIDHEDLEETYPRLFEQPFDSDRKRMTTVHRIQDRNIAYTKGAVDELLPLCTHMLTAAGVRPMTETDRRQILSLCNQMSEQALRVLGFAMRTLEHIPGEEDDSVECDLTFVGITGMIDPPRKEVARSVATCQHAGIRTVMITGDHKVTALAIARELGIYRPGNTVLSGDELDAMSEEDLDAAVGTTTVFSRVSPADKLRIIQSLKRTGEVTAMTGDGVNDSPALKAADIGVAMGVTGTDVAKDASDMILLDDSFTTIAYAIKEGRRVYRNIQKVIQFLLVGNIAEILTLFLATALNWEAPLLAVHILWVNLATATLPALALGVDPASKNIMKHPPVRSGTLFERDLVRRVVTQGIFVALLTTAAYWIGVRMADHTTGQTMAFCVLALSQMLRAFNQRSNTEPIWVRAEGINPWLIVSFGVSALLMAAILWIPPLQSAFQLTTLSGLSWLVVLGLSLLSILQVEVSKALRRLGT